MSFEVKRAKDRVVTAIVATGIITASLLPNSAAAFGPARLAEGLGRNIVRIQGETRTQAPFASVLFCARHPDQCADTGGDEVVELSSSQKSELLQVNAVVNRAIKPTNDSPGTDDWSVDVTRGDCEDYALTKRKKLLEMGWPSRSLLLAIARTSSGEGHAVLIVKTSVGDLVLDNRVGVVKDWRNTDLRFMLIQSKNDPRVWNDVEAGSDIMASVPRRLLPTAEIRRPASRVHEAADIGFY